MKKGDCEIFQNIHSVTKIRLATKAIEQCSRQFPHDKMLNERSEAPFRNLLVTEASVSISTFTCAIQDGTG